MRVQKILLANPRGFCAGVEMSVKALIWMVRTLTNKNVYCYHGIVHNNLVLQWFANNSVSFINDLSEIRHADESVALMLSAHGTDPKIVQAARDRFSIVVDAACPLVTRVHNELVHAQLRMEEVIYLGDPGHDEGAGTLSVQTRKVHTVEPEKWREDVAALEIPAGRRIRLLTQTTLSQALFKDVLAALRGRFGDISTPEKGDMCFATTNRQDALLAMAKQCDSVIVIGSVKSANSVALWKLASTVRPSVLLEDVMELANHNDLEGVVGITAGASAPEMLVQEICDAIAPADGVEIFEFTREPEYFRPPRGLRVLAARPDITPHYDLAKDREISVLELMQNL